MCILRRCFRPRCSFLPRPDWSRWCPTPRPGCPSAKDVEEALYARVPGAVIPFSEAKRRGALAAQRSRHRPPTAAGASPLVDNAGQSRLQRPLAASERAEGLRRPGRDGRAHRAAVPDRARRSGPRDPVQVHTPLPLTPIRPIGPDRRWDLSLASGWRVGSEVWGALAIGARAGRLLGEHRTLPAGRRGRRGRAKRRLEPIGREDFRGTARARQFPLELGLWWRTVGWREPSSRWARGVAWTHPGGDPGGFWQRGTSRWLPGPIVFAVRRLCACPCAARHSFGSRQAARAAL